MKKPTTKKAGLPKVRRRAVAADAEWVNVAPLFDDGPIPTLVTPRVEGLGLVDWASTHTEQLMGLWERDRAVLLRGFDVEARDGFRAFTDIAGEGPRLPYVDRSTPREDHGSSVYCTTIYPAEQTIRLHNEGSYWAAHPLKAFFTCVTPPPVGGETPIADVHAVHERIDPAVREEFARRRWMLVRNYHAGFALRWQDVFQTESRDEVEAYCGKNRIECEWLSGGGLRTRQVRDPILHHPRTGEPLWHNHAAFFHISTRDAEVREALSSEFEADELPYNTYYGDGGAIDADVVRHINEAYDAELVKFRWQPGDVLMIDNVRVAHAREPYEGDRLILVALKEAFVPEAAA